MFPEYRDLISKLKNSNRHFERLFEQHNELDHQVANMISGNIAGSPEMIETLKKKKLKIKDEIHNILKQHSASS